uniref:Guanylate kinase n=1 Tax=Ackermannviridae sp. TaxID=2831612 RepID=A0A8S5VLJ5_9CAUD|nr:MAG TPA: Guanylate kinase [Ackermannviridae sp.]
MPNLRRGVPRGFQHGSAEIYLPKQAMPAIWAGCGGAGTGKSGAEGELPGE